MPRRKIRVAGVEGILEGPAGAKKIALLVHGFMADCEEFGNYTVLARALGRKGIASFRPNMNYSCRTGKAGFMRMTPLGEALRIRRLVNAFRKKGLLVSAVGASFGGYCLSLAGFRKELSSLVLWYPLIDPARNRRGMVNPELSGEQKDLLRTKQFVELEKSSTGEKFWLSQEYLRQVSTENGLTHAEKLKLPVLVLVPRKDFLVKVGQQKEYARLACGKIRLIDANHGWKDRDTRRKMDRVAGLRACELTADWILSR